jgi:hypothetical protein
LAGFVHLAFTIEIFSGENSGLTHEFSHYFSSLMILKRAHAFDTHGNIGKFVIDLARVIQLLHPLLDGRSDLWTVSG